MTKTNRGGPGVCVNTMPGLHTPAKRQRKGKAIPGWLAYEHQVFKDADHFTYIYRVGGWAQRREEFKTWPEAKARAEARPEGELFLIYAVTTKGRSAQIDVTPAYDALWMERGGK